MGVHRIPWRCWKVGRRNLLMPPGAHAEARRSVASMVNKPTRSQVAAAQAAENRRTAHVASYMENAKQWWDSARQYYVVKFNLGGTSASYMGSSELDADDVSGLLQGIESIGWILHNVGYVYQPLKEQSHLLTDSAHMSGSIIGIYTFKRPPPRPDI